MQPMHVVAASGRSSRHGYGGCWPRFLQLVHPSKDRSPSGTSCSALHRSVRLLRLLLTPAAPSRRLSTAVAHLFPGAGRQASQGKTRDLRAIYLSHLRPHPSRVISGFGSMRPLARMRTPHMRWLFVRPALCLQLPSDPASRRRPCCSASGSHHQGPQRTCTSKSWPDTNPAFRCSRTTRQCLAHAWVLGSPLRSGRG
jgi:hypothetical protein